MRAKILATTGQKLTTVGQKLATLCRWQLMVENGHCWSKTATVGQKWQLVVKTGNFVSNGDCVSKMATDGRNCPLMVENGSFESFLLDGNFWYPRMLISPDVPRSNYDTCIIEYINSESECSRPDLFDGIELTQSAVGLALTDWCWFRW